MVRNLVQRIWPMAWTTGLVGALLIFVAPFFVPSRPIQSVSASYLAAFNNTVAIRAAAVLSFLVYLWAVWRRTLVRPEACVQEEGLVLDRRFLAGVILANAAVLAFSGSLVMASGTRYLGDAGYIIEQASVLRDTGRSLYSQIEFAYGPLLIWPEVWVSRILHCGMSLAYFVTLVIESSLGILLLAYVLNQIPTRGSLRKWALGLFVLAALTPHLGLNYTFLRFASPLAILLFGTRSDSLPRCALLLTAGEAIELLISPELALVLLVGAITFAILRAVQDGWVWLLTGVLPLAALAVLLQTAGRAYLQMASSFTRGALNLPIGPYPHILIFLTALVWVVPFSLGTWLSWRDANDARLLALFASSVAFVQAALGRCDPVHIVFNGIGIFALSLFAFSRGNRRLSYAWVATLAGLVLWSQFVNQRFFQMRTADVLAHTVIPHLPSPLRILVTSLAASRSLALEDALSPARADLGVDLEPIEALVGSACITAPLDIAPRVENQLRRSHQYRPGYYAFWVDMMNLPSEQRSIRDLGQCPWMLIPDFSLADSHTPAGLSALQGLTLPYRVRNRQLYQPGAAFQRELDQNWTRVATAGSYSLMKRSPPG